ncbi:MAG: hypothetical protein BJ554DRAFT_4655 [Olpidium bornovanus]|uniref:Exosome complex component N-terminal domain-containing protein n=1 Tax=Olpidium bornovanus TaxID=278681 RepID=A0A8H8A006_9FUNG|nr:MAG: hypothetical protein BJ554DRAFT_4655 [Olpidium bornovanus]
MADVVVPGQRLGYLDDYSPGPGTYVRGDLILASVVGFRRVAEATVAETGKKRSANGEPPEGGAAADSEKDEGGSVEDAEPVPPVLFVTREKEKTGVPDVDSIVRFFPGTLAAAAHSPRG